MITADSITQIGTVLKTHGVHGELTVALEADDVLSEEHCIVMDIDGIYVPFYLIFLRPKSAARALITIDGYHSDEAAREFVGKKVYMLNSDLGDRLGTDDDEGIYLDDLVDMTLVDEEGTTVGRITGYDDSTANIVLGVELPDGRKVFVPMAAELFIDIDYSNRRLQLEIPQGLLEL